MAGQQGQGGGRGGGDLQQGGRLDFAPASTRDLEVNTSASRAQADKSTLKVQYFIINPWTAVINC